MTEAEWLVCEEPKAILEHFRDRFSHRKLRLFGCACCFSIWEHLKDESRAAVWVAERYAEGVADDTERWAARKEALVAQWESAECSAAISLADTSAVSAANDASVEAAGQGWVFGPLGRNQIDEEQFGVERAEQTTLLRDIFGNPFRPVEFDAEWRTSTAVAFAKQMYESRDFSAMPILADALKDAGCDNSDILSHCRNANVPHVRG